MIGIVVTTGEHKGVFFGYVENLPDLDKSRTITLEKCRMCVYWPKEQHGVVGLSSDGPQDGSKISPAAPKMILADVNAVMVCTDKANKEWEKDKWH